MSDCSEHYSFEEELQFPLNKTQHNESGMKNLGALRGSFSLPALQSTSSEWPPNTSDVSFILNASEPSFLHHSSLLSLSDTSVHETDSVISRAFNNISPITFQKTSENVMSNSKLSRAKPEKFSENAAAKSTSIVSSGSNSRKLHSDLSMLISKRLDDCITRIFNSSRLGSRHSIRKTDTPARKSSKSMNGSCLILQHEKAKADSTNTMVFDCRKMYSSSSSEESDWNKAFCQLSQNDSGNTAVVTNHQKMHSTTTSSSEESDWNKAFCQLPQNDSGNTAVVTNRQKMHSTISSSSEERDWNKAFCKLLQNDSGNIAAVADCQKYSSSLDESDLNRAFIRLPLCDSGNTDKSDNLLDKAFTDTLDPDSSFSIECMGRGAGPLPRLVVQDFTGIQKDGFSVFDQDELNNYEAEKLFLDALVVSEHIKLEDSGTDIAMMEIELYSSSGEDEPDTPEGKEITQKLKRYFADVTPLSLDRVSSLSLKPRVSNLKDNCEPLAPIVAPSIQLDKAKLQSKFREKKSYSLKRQPMKAFEPVSKMITKLTGRGVASPKSSPQTVGGTYLPARTSTPVSATSVKIKNDRPLFVPSSSINSLNFRSPCNSTPRKSYESLTSSDSSSGNGIRRSMSLKNPVHNAGIKMSTPIQSAGKMATSSSVATKHLSPRSANISNISNNRPGHQKSKSSGNLPTIASKGKPVAVTHQFIPRTMRAKGGGKENRYPSY